MIRRNRSKRDAGAPPSVPAVADIVNSSVAASFSVMRIHVHPQRNGFCLDAFDDLHQSRIWQCDGAGCLLCSLPARER
jgi:hypothetical protein